MAVKPSSSPLTSFTTNSFSEHPMGVIGMAVFVGMGLMFLSIIFGAPILLSMICLLGGIFLVYGYKVGRTEYTIYPEGIAQNIHLFIPKALGRKPKERFFEWGDIKSYRHDEDFKRSLESYEFIKLYLKKSPGQVWITNEKNKEGFESFRDAFLSIVDNETSLQLIQRNNSSTSSTTEPEKEFLKHDATIAQSSARESQSLHEKKQKEKTVHIKKKRSFYKSIFAKLLTIFFLVLIVGFISYGVVNGMRVGNWFRVLLILLPGTAYMFYRSFVKKQ